MNKVYVTGMGSINPLAHNVPGTWEAIQEGKCGIAEITAYDTSKRKVTLAAEVKDYQAENYFPAKEARHMDRFIQFAVIASKEAKENAQLAELVNPYRVGVIVSSGIGGIGTIESEHQRAIEKDAIDRVNPFFIPKTITNMAAAHVAMLFGAKGVCESVSTACASSTNAIGNAFRLIRNGDMDVMICGGSEASITPLSMGGFTSMRALTTATDPNRASIPFDADRSGFVMGEGAGILILESEAHMKARGAKPLAEILGYSSTCDAHHITAPEASGQALVYAMQDALDQAGLSTEELDYINCHGTSTSLNDSTESHAIEVLFGEAIEKQPFASSSKSMTGHLLGATGALETIISVLALENGELPVNRGYENEDPDCKINLVTSCGKKADLKCAMTNNLGFGGHNTSLILGKV